MVFSRFCCYAIIKYVWNDFFRNDWSVIIDFNNYNYYIHIHEYCSSFGISAKKQVPANSLSSNMILPFIESSACLIIYIPFPWSLAVFVVMPSSNMFGMISLEMPGPLSSISITIFFPMSVNSSCTVGFLTLDTAVNALSIKLPSIIKTTFRNDSFVRTSKELSCEISSLIPFSFAILYFAINKPWITGSLIYSLKEG